MDLRMAVDPKDRENFKPQYYLPVNKYWGIEIQILPNNLVIYMTKDVFCKHYQRLKRNPEGRDYIQFPHRSKHGNHSYKVYYIDELEKI